MSSKSSSSKNTNINFIFCLFLLWIFLFSNIFNKDTKIEKKKFEDVIGLESVKKEIKYYMKLIKHKEKYKKWNVRLPKGILLIGPPGTGKTLLVKSLSQELEMPILNVSGSDFVEMYVGVGASRVRKLFAKAKKKKTCIIFIDEIDAVGSKREKDNNSERASTLNQLLVEMDGFKETNNILVFAATNLLKLLDNALLRSGRFDKKIFFDLPNKEERKLMYRLFFKGINLPEKLSYDLLAERTVGVSGADISNIANQSKMNAIMRGSIDITLNENDIQDAIDEVIIGREKRERTLTSEERERVAYHEAGHSLMGYLLKYSNPPIKVSIIPRGEFALGFSQPKPDNKKLYSKNEILSRIAVLLGGRVAEFIIYNNYSTGASDDIEKISLLIRDYTVKWGMNEKLGALNPNVMDLLGKKLSDEIFIDCQKIINKIEQITIEYLTENKKYIIKIAKDLLKNETIDYRRIRNLIPKNIENSKEIIL